MNKDSDEEYPEIISTAQLCEMLDISETTALKLINSKKIKAKKVGRAHKILKYSVLEYLMSDDVA